MDYREAIAYILEIPKFTKKNSLEHTKDFLRILGNPEKGKKIIHVAGTNGKGSVCAYMQSLLLTEKKTVGFFTSPHLVKMNERIRIDGEEISDEMFLSTFDIVFAAVQKMKADGKPHPTFFEFLFAMAMTAFADSGVEYIILETGLGGRLDATNAIDVPFLTIITSISLDHTEILGETIEEIAAEKAGILKRDVPIIYIGKEEKSAKALSAVLQLGVTMDYSIFLWHSYQENQERFPNDKDRAMAHAISNTFSSVLGSSVTTVAGFIALCFMSFTLGMDLGIVMAKGVVFGVLSCVTILPSFILVFDKWIEKTSHRSLIPKMEKLTHFVTDHYKVFAVVFLLVLGPAVWGYTKADVYYNLDATLPKYLDSIKANEKLSNTFDMNATHMVLADADLSSKEAKEMLQEMSDVKGVKFALGLDSLLGSSIPRDMIPGELTETLKQGDWQLILVQSEYKAATDEVNKQCTELNKIIKSHDKSAMLIGEAPCTKDLITITDKDFKVVSAISIIAIFIIIAFVFKSGSLPLILVSVIEFAIFINLGIPYYTGVKMPFIASIVIGTIQLGATVDYAILMTTRYKKERCKGKPKKEAVYIALSTSISSVIVSALGFFAATFGVGLYSDIDMISALCSLMARGAIISMFTVIFILPSALMIFDKPICATTKGMRSMNQEVTNYEKQRL